MKRTSTELRDCEYTPESSKKLAKWGKTILRLGLFLFVVLLVSGGIISYFSATVVEKESYGFGSYKYVENFYSDIFLTEFFPYLIYAFITFCATYTLYVLLTAIADITKDTASCEKIVMYTAAMIEERFLGSNTENTDTVTQSTDESVLNDTSNSTPVTNFERFPIKSGANEITCPTCNAKQDSANIGCSNCGQKFKKY